MKKRLIAFDYLRVFALVLILACHFFRTIGDCGMVDLPLGAVGNVIFFAMSGWLLGMISGRGYGVKFLWHRLVRLSIPLWIFAIPYMTFLAGKGFPLRFRDVVLNLFLLNWFDRLPGMTPYWFVTAIAVFYVLLCIVMHIRPLRQCRTLPCVTLLFGMVMLQIGLSFLGIRFGYILIMMGAALACFFWGDLFYDHLMHLSHRWIVAAFAGLSFPILWWLYFKGYITNGAPSGYWSALIVATLYAAAIISLFRAASSVAAICFLSNIGYEVYLVHSALLLGLSGLFCSRLVFAVVFLVSAVMGGYLLHAVAGWVSRRIEGKA